MLLTYVDESYSDDWYYMAALVCGGASVKSITQELDSVVDHALANYDVAPDPELHGYELFQGSGWWTNVPPRARIGLYAKAFDAIAAHCDTIILRGVHVAGLRSRYSRPDPPHSVVLQHLLERVDDYMQQNDEHVLIIADEVGEQSKHRDALSMYRKSGTWGYRSKKLTRIVDTLHFAPSNASRLIQAVDLVAFMHRRRSCHTESDPRAERANQALWDRISTKIWHEWCWYP